MERRGGSGGMGVGRDASGGIGSGMGAGDGAYVGCGRRSYVQTNAAFGHLSATVSIHVEGWSPAQWALSFTKFSGAHVFA